MSYPENGAQLQEGHHIAAISSGTTQTLSTPFSGTQPGYSPAGTTTRIRAQSRTCRPFSRTPVEIIAHIFIHTQRLQNNDSDVEPQRERTHSGSTVQTSDVMARTKSFFPTLRTTPLAFLMVCRLWRSIALSTPQLWTHLVLDDRRVISPSSSEVMVMRSIQRERQALKAWLERSAGRDLSLTIRRQVQAGKHRGYVDLANGRLASIRNAKMDPVLYDERQGLGRELMLFLERSKRVSIEGNKVIIARVVRALQRFGSSLESPHKSTPGPACRLESLSLKVLHGTHIHSITMDISRLLPPLKRLRSFCVSTDTGVIGGGQEVLVVSPAPEASSFASARRRANGCEDRDNAMVYSDPELRELIFDRVYWMSKRQMVKWMVCFPGLEKMEVGLDLNPGYSIPTAELVLIRSADSCVLEMKRLKYLTLNVRIGDGSGRMMDGPGIMHTMREDVDGEASQLEVLVSLPALEELTINVLPTYHDARHQPPVLHPVVNPHAAADGAAHPHQQPESQGPMLSILYHQFFQAHSPSQLGKLTIHNIRLVAEHDLRSFIGSLALMDRTVVVTTLTA